VGLDPDDSDGGDVLLAQRREHLWEHHGEESFGEGREEK